MKKVARSSEAILAQVKNSLGAAKEPIQRETIERHYRNLEQLAQSLRGLGLNDQGVDEAVIAVFEEYEQQLRRYITTVQPN